MQNKIESLRYNSIEEIYNEVKALHPDWKSNKQAYLNVVVKVGTIFNGTGDGANKIECPKLLKQIILDILKTKFPTEEELSKYYDYLEKNELLDMETVCYLDALYSATNDKYRNELRESHAFCDYIKMRCGIDINETYATKEQLVSLSESCQKYLEVENQPEKQAQPQ